MATTINSNFSLSLSTFSDLFHLKKKLISSMWLLQCVHHTISQQRSLRELMDMLSLPPVVLLMTLGPVVVVPMVPVFRFLTGFLLWNA